MKRLVHFALFVATAAVLSATEKVEAPVEWKDWPLAPSDRSESPDIRNVIDPDSVPPVPAFPGAEGHGALSIGGRGGRVIKVTTLSATGPGSLDEALRARGPRIVVFEVSGVIRGDFRITEPNITVAGQTAPGAGITIEGTLYTTDIPRAPNSGNIILRFLRIRVPPAPPHSANDLDAVRILGADRVIVDHISASWAVDEVTGSPHSTNVTFQWCTVEESATEGHVKGLHNYGMKGADYPYGFIHHNLMAHHSRRNPSATAHVINNVVYDFRDGFVSDSKPPPPDLFYASNIIGNYYKEGPSTRPMRPMLFQKHTAYYARDNYIDGIGLIRDPWLDAEKHEGLESVRDNGKRLSAPRPYPYFPVTIHDPERAYGLVLAQAGCLPRDRVSRRTVQEVRNGTGKWGRQAPASPSDEWYLEGLKPAQPLADDDSDGIPNTWELTRGLDPTNPDDAAEIVPRGASQNDRHAGFTWIEFYLNELADQLVAQAMNETGVSPDSDMEN